MCRNISTKLQQKIQTMHQTQDTKKVGTITREYLYFKCMWWIHSYCKVDAQDI